jgi:hypothetical protein
MDRGIILSFSIVQVPKKKKKKNMESSKEQKNKVFETK